MEMISKDLLRRWLSGNCTAEEVIRIKNDLQEKGAEAVAQQLEEDWQRAEGAMDTSGTERLLTNIRSYVQPQEQPTAKASVIKLHHWKRITVAAAILAIVSTGGWYLLKQSRNTGKYAAKQRWHTIENKEHHKVNISLPDHSEVWLAAGATLQYATDFGKEDRQVQLVGEAFFEVAKDSLHPFTVQAGNVNTRVLGTHFNVEAYEAESFTRISLVEGKVTATYIGANKQDTFSTLLPGNRLCYNRSSARGKIEPINLDEQAFTGTSIVLQDISLTTALHRIGRHYGKNIQLQDSVHDRQQFSAIVPGNDLEAALNNLAFVYQLQYQVGKDTIRIYKN
jgi:transmembrane sensor